MGEILCGVIYLFSTIIALALVYDNNIYDEMCKEFDEKLGCLWILFSILPIINIAVIYLLISSKNNEYEEF